MRIARVADQEGRILHALPGEESGVFRELRGSWREGFCETGQAIEGARLLPPVNPAVIYAIGLNYRDHATETGAPIPEYPVLFSKNPRSVTAPGEAVRLPRRLRSDEVDAEAELAVVIGRDCLNATREHAMQYVAGFTCANDVSARDWQKKRSGGQWCRAKSFDTFCPLGPWIATPDEFTVPLELEISGRLNGSLMQQSNTSRMIFDVPTLIEFLSADMTLPAGAVILTGTPHGVGMARNPPVWLRPGDKIEVEIEGIGTLANPVIEGER